MGSPCEIQVISADDAAAQSALAAATADIDRLERKYSRYRDDSLLSRINAVAAKGGEMEVDAETAALLDYAAACHAQSDGLFDITSGVLRKAWRFDGTTSLPDQGAIESLLDRVGWEKLRWSRPWLAFPNPGLELDFGGIVKEYAADRAAALCRSQGLTSGAVNLGGDISIIGPRPDGPWRIGIRAPRDKDGVARALGLREGALASSGDYERCMIVDGTRYGHILNPRTGWPTRHLASVSVAADLCILAGSTSTIAMLKEGDGPAWLESTGLPCLWIGVDGETGGALAALAGPSVPA